MTLGASRPGLFCLLAFLSAPAFAAFGRNKVVWKDFDWKVAKTDHFDVYYYEGSAGWAPTAAEILERAYRIGKEKIGHAPSERRAFFRGSLFMPDWRRVCPFLQYLSCLLV